MLITILGYQHSYAYSYPQNAVDKTYSRFEYIKLNTLIKNIKIIIFYFVFRSIYTIFAHKSKEL